MNNGIKINSKKLIKKQLKTSKDKDGTSNNGSNNLNELSSSYFYNLLKDQEIDINTKISDESSMKYHSRNQSENDQIIEAAIKSRSSF